MAGTLTERTVAIVDSASTWEGVCRVVRGRRGTTTLRANGRAFGRVGADTVEARFPGKLPRSVVRHDLADGEIDEGWTRLDLADGTTVHDAVALLRVAYLVAVARARRDRPDAFESVDIDAGLSELDPLPGLVHLVREQARA